MIKTTANRLSKQNMAINPEVTAEYVIEASFRITGRGIVFAGKILEGIVHVGDTIEFDTGNGPRRRIIAGRTMFGKLPPHDSVGIMIKCISDDEIEELRKWEPNNVFCVVYNTHNPASA